MNTASTYQYKAADTGKRVQIEVPTGKRDHEMEPINEWRPGTITLVRPDGRLNVTTDDRRMWIDVDPNCVRLADLNSVADAFADWGPDKIKEIEGVTFVSPPCQHFYTRNTIPLHDSMMDRITRGIDAYCADKGMKFISVESMNKAAMLELPHRLNKWQDFATLPNGQLFYWNSRRQLWIRN